MSKNVQNFSRSSFLVMSKKWQKFSPNFTSIHRFCLPSSTISLSSYFNSSYYSFFTFLTLYPVFFNISKKNLLRANGWGFNPPNPLAYASGEESQQTAAELALEKALDHTNVGPM